MEKVIYRDIDFGKGHILFSTLQLSTRKVFIFFRSGIYLKGSALMPLYQQEQMLYITSNLLRTEDLLSEKRRSDVTFHFRSPQCICSIFVYISYGFGKFSLNIHLKSMRFIFYCSKICNQYKPFLFALMFFRLI